MKSISHKYIRSIGAIELELVLMHNFDKSRCLAEHCADLYVYAPHGCSIFNQIFDTLIVNKI